MNTLSKAELLSTKTPFTKIVISDKCPLHNHAFYEFTICTVGSYYNTINGVTHKIETGNVILLRPQDAHVFYTLAPHTHRDIYIEKELFKSLCSLIDDKLFDSINNEPLSINFNLSIMEITNFENKLNTLLSVTDDDVFAKSLHVNIITEILFAWLKKTHSNSSQYPLWLSSLIANINTEQGISGDIETLIASTHYTHSYVCRQFKYYTGRSLQDYISEVKFTYAKSLLVNESVTVSQVASRLNYSSVSNFTYAFKKKFGITPTEYKEALFNQ